VFQPRQLKQFFKSGCALSFQKGLKIFEISQDAFLARASLMGASSGGTGTNKENTHEKN
jgi:hypothetical protein